MLQLTFARGMAPGFPPVHVGCVMGCDVLLTDIIYAGGRYG